MTTDEGRAPEFMVREKDGREVRFDGVLLGFATSAKPGKDRWGEISVHRTEAGSYVTSGVGKTSHPDEHEKWWASVSLEPAGAIESLHMIDDGGTRYMPGVNRRALELAMEADPALRDAYRVETIA